MLLDADNFIKRRGETIETEWKHTKSGFSFYTLFISPHTYIVVSRSIDKNEQKNTSAQFTERNRRIEEKYNVNLNLHAERQYREFERATSVTWNLCHGLCLVNSIQFNTVTLESENVNR